MNNLDESLKKIIIKNLRSKVPEDAIDETVNIFKIFGLDSLQTVKIIADIETEFNISIGNEPDLLSIMARFGKLRDYIAEKIA